MSMGIFDNGAGLLIVAYPVDVFIPFPPGHLAFAVLSDGGKEQAEHFIIGKFFLQVEADEFVFQAKGLQFFPGQPSRRLPPLC